MSSKILCRRAAHPTSNRLAQQALGLPSWLIIDAATHSPITDTLKRLLP